MNSNYQSENQVHARATKSGNITVWRTLCVLLLLVSLILGVLVYVLITIRQPDPYSPNSGLYATQIYPLQTTDHTAHLRAVRTTELEPQYAAQTASGSLLVFRVTDRFELTNDAEAETEITVVYETSHPAEYSPVIMRAEGQTGCEVYEETDGNWKYCRTLIIPSGRTVTLELCWVGKSANEIWFGQDYDQISCQSHTVTLIAADWFEIADQNMGLVLSDGVWTADLSGVPEPSLTFRVRTEES